MTSLSTHVLDTTQGKPAAGVRLTLSRVDGSARTLVAERITNADGRVDDALLDPDGENAGAWELVFFVGDYFAGQPVETVSPPFLDEIAIRFTIAPDTGHYHVPLLVSPWAYTTYRGS